MWQGPSKNLIYYPTFESCASGTSEKLLKISCYWGILKKWISTYIVGGFNPFEKYLSKWESSPILRVKKQNIWNHHTSRIFTHLFRWVVPERHLLDLRPLPYPIAVVFMVVLALKHGSFPPKPFSTDGSPVNKIHKLNPLSLIPLDLEHINLYISFVGKVLQMVQHNNTIFAFLVWNFYGAGPWYWPHKPDIRKHSWSAGESETSQQTLLDL